MKIFRVTLTVAVLGLFLLVASNDIASNLAHPLKYERYLKGDSSHYLKLAEDFNRGVFPYDKITRSMSHRQLLYPLALSGTSLIGGDTISSLVYFNVWVALCTSLVLIFCGLKLYGSFFAGLLTAVLLLANPFYLDNVTSDLMTEPLFILTSLCSLIFSMMYLRDYNTRYCYYSVGFAALSYLTRPNGLFFGIGLITCICLTRLLTTSDDDFRIQLKMALKLGVFSTLLFVLITIPSWVPRLLQTGNPFYHYYLPNYLWADTYEQAHQTKIFYTFNDYAASHGLNDILARIKYGLKFVFWAAPLSAYSARLYYLFAFALFTAIVNKKVELLFLLCLLGVSHLPTIWSSVANPTIRIPSASLLPFLLLFSMHAIFVVLNLLNRLRQQVSKKEFSLFTTDC